MFRLYGLLGLISIVSSYILSFFELIPYGPVSVALNNFLLMVGLWLFFDAVDFKINKTSLLHKVKSKSKTVLYLILIGVLTGLFIEFFGAFVSNLWWEPFYTYLSEKPIYQAILIFFSTAIAITYVLLLPAVYSVYHVLNHFFEKIKLQHKMLRDKDEKIMFHYLGIVGLFFIIIPLPIVMFLNLIPLIRGILFIFPLLGLWFLLEYVEHSQHKRSLLMDLLELRTGKLIAVFLTSIFLGLMSEGINLFAPGWEYKNFPFASFKIFGIPAIILFGWIPLIIIFLSFYRVFIKENDHLF